MDAQEIIARIAGNEEWLGRYKALARDDTAGLAALCREAGYDVSEADVKAALPPEGELSDEALEAIAGGGAIGLEGWNREANKDKC